IINSPSFVVVSGIGAVGPPGVVVGFVIEMPEAVNKTAINKIVEPLAFFGKETGNFGISYRIVDVDGAMTDIVIATNNQVWDVFFQVVHILPEIVHKGEFGLQTF